MLKFFRRIRKQLLHKNKFGKYLLYAIGEIILVVIGILIALQFNSWNQDSKNKITEGSYLKNLISDLDEDITHLKRLQRSDTLRLDAYTTVLRAFKEKEIRENLPMLLDALFKSSSVHGFFGNSNVFEDMKSSGKINLIRSDSIRILIINYYSWVNTAIIGEHTNNTTITRIKEDIILTPFDYNSLMESYGVMPDQWKSEVNELDLSFFELDVKNKKVDEFSHIMSRMKTLLLSNHYIRRESLKRAEKLKSGISNYLQKK